ncbi:DNA-directed RNA polymerase subunit omega [Desulfoscipio sp. XC116]|uniref:DNA-directed RNA polymerase subunit omega n=1 Tax=Desulfoscipio sp. XC116 TaxID=3144975 RepID=UPI00325C199A
MNKPSLDNLMDKVDSRYTLVVISAKRARQITEIALQQDQEEGPWITGKPVSAALHEVVRGNVTYRRTKQGIK